MAYRTQKSLLIDEILRLAATTTLTLSVLLAPNTIQFFDKRIQRYFSKLDQAKRQREIQATLRYIRRQKLISEDYEFGLQITKKAKLRLEQRRVYEITLPQHVKWDGMWRIVFFDIPEKHKASRDAFAGHIRRVGFKVLQRSVFVYPFDCRQEVEAITMHYHVSKYVSYIEARYIDNQEQLKKVFNTIM